MATLLLVHAHPDDESISTGGVMMKAKAHGHRVVLITATRGEVGEIYNMDEAASRPRLGEIRTQELKAACEILGVDRQEFLGYRDSGMVDTADNKDPRSFHQAKLEEAAGKLAVFLREERPDVVVTYAEDGVYGHPDHIKAHYVTNAALDLVEREGAPVKKLLHRHPALGNGGVHEADARRGAPHAEPEHALRRDARRAGDHASRRARLCRPQAPILCRAREPERPQLVLRHDAEPDLRARIRHGVLPAREGHAWLVAPRRRPLRGGRLGRVTAPARLAGRPAAEPAPVEGDRSAAALSRSRRRSRFARHLQLDRVGHLAARPAR